MWKRTHHRFNTACDLALIVGFLATLTVPLLVFFHSGGDPAPVLMERRAPNPAPRLTRDAESWLDYPAALRRYYADAFPFRRELVRWHNRIKAFWLGDSPSLRITAGRDGWLFSTFDQVIEGQRGLTRFTDEQLIRWKVVLEERRDWLQARGAKYLFVVAPNKHAIYPEMLPARIRPANPVTAYDQFDGFLRRESSVVPLDLRPALLEAKEGRQVYYPLGTHWNDIGAFVGYRTIMQALRPSFPELRPLGFEEMVIGEGAGVGDSLAERLLIPELYSQPNPELTPREPRPDLGIRMEQIGPRVFVGTTDNPQGLKAVVFHDSFGQIFSKFFTRHFSRIVWVWTPQFDTKVIERENPDVVIDEWTERFLFVRKPGRLPERLKREVARVTGQDSDAAEKERSRILKRLQGRLGIYRNPHAGDIRLTLEDDRVWMERSTRRRPLTVVNDHTLRAADEGSQLLLRLAVAEGHVSRLFLNDGDGQRGVVFAADEEPAPDTDALESLTGEYDGPVAKYSVHFTGRRLVIFTDEDHSLFELIPRAPDCFGLVEDARGSVEFLRDSAGVGMELAIRAEVNRAIRAK